MAVQAAAAAVPAGESGHVRVTAAEGIYRPWLGATLALSDSVLGYAVNQGGPVVADSDRSRSARIRARWVPSAR
jgi:hypothetical protein